MTQWVTERARQQGLDAGEIRFSQRQVREALQRGDRGLRRHLARLVELKYVAVQRTGRGNLRAYQLVCGGDPAMSGLSPLGLVDWWTSSSYGPAGLPRVDRHSDCWGGSPR